MAEVKTIAKPMVSCLSELVSYLTSIIMQVYKCVASCCSTA